MRTLNMTNYQNVNSISPQKWGQRYRDLAKEDGNFIATFFIKDLKLV